MRLDVCYNSLLNFLLHMTQRLKDKQNWHIMLSSDYQYIFAVAWRVVPLFLSFHPEWKSGGTEVQDMSFGVRMHLGLDPGSLLPVSGCSAPGRLLTFSKLQFPHLESGRHPTSKADCEYWVRQCTQRAKQMSPTWFNSSKWRRQQRTSIMSEEGDGRLMRYVLTQDIFFLLHRI